MEYVGCSSANHTLITWLPFQGRYVPMFAAEIYDGDAKAIEQELTPINLASIMIGDPATDFFVMYRGYYEMQCKHMTIAPVQPIRYVRLYS